MNIKIEKKNSDKYLLLLGDEKEVKGTYLTKSELKKLQSNLNELIEYDSNEVGDNI